MAKIPPPWLKPGEPAQPIEQPALEGRDSKARFKKGFSGNPKGRPVGIVDRRYRWSKVLQDEADDIIRVVVEAALAGDMTAAAIIISRVVPALRPEGERVEFVFDATSNQVTQVEQVLQAMAHGHVSVEVAKQIIDAIAQLSGVRQVHELDQRIKALEEHRS